MTNEKDSQTLQKIKKIHERIVITAGIAMGIALSSYFFTFGMLIDRDATFMLWFQVVTSVLFIFGLIYIKPLALLLVRVLLASNSDCRQMLKGMKVADLEKV
ncbi:MAG TPA: hypothetical protein ENJ65_00465 [Candidatus Tenderia electrophaga]|uniref:Uncharacterized protein n=1 Tax=Candidatus Tenderia electrophaga TaxID=1748243 RepID=A0A832N2M2_9GAMM|nr:hypothetical protein [Candidatus Tenderia electrophaga]